MWGFGEAYPIYILLYPRVGSVMRSDDLVLCEVDFLAQTPTAGHNVYGAAEVGLKSARFSLCLPAFGLDHRDTDGQEPLKAISSLHNLYEIFTVTSNNLSILSSSQRHQADEFN